MTDQPTPRAAEPEHDDRCVYVVSTIGLPVDRAVLDAFRSTLSSGTEITGVTVHIRESADAVLAAATPEPTAPDYRCTCEPCAGRGNDGHGLTHCAECCMGTGIEDADPDCPVPVHRALAERQHGPAPDDLREQIDGAIAGALGDAFEKALRGEKPLDHNEIRDDATERVMGVLRRRGLVK